MGSFEFQQTRRRETLPRLGTLLPHDDALRRHIKTNRKAEGNQLIEGRVREGGRYGSPSGDTCSFHPPLQYILYVQFFHTFLFSLSAVFAPPPPAAVFTHSLLTPPPFSICLAGLDGEEKTRPGQWC